MQVIDVKAFNLITSCKVDGPLDDDLVGAVHPKDEVIDIYQAKEAGTNRERFRLCMINTRTVQR